MTATRSGERRAAPRHLYKTAPVVHRGPRGLSEGTTGQLLNISTTGAQILIRGEFSPDEQIVLALLSYKRQPIVELAARIRWRQVEARGVERLGIDFSRPLSADELAQV